MFYLQNNIEDVAEQETNEDHQKQNIDIFWLEPARKILDQVRKQKHLGFSLHVLDHVVDGEEQEEGGDGDADVGEDENARHFDLRNLSSSKYQRIVRRGIHLLQKNYFKTFSFSFTKKLQKDLMFFHLTVAFNLFVAMIQSIAAIVRP